MKVAVAQICTSRDVEANLALISEYTARAAEAGAQLVVFPEASMRAFGHNLSEIAEPLDGPFATRLRGLAHDHNITLVVGMFTPGEAGKVHNTLFAAGPDEHTSYDKIHLYDAFGFTESDTVDGGDDVVRVQVGSEVVGLSTCYDARFPQLYIEHARKGARIMVISASWAGGPGKAEQWDLLVRARAIDSTSFVLACDQAVPEVAGVDAPQGAPAGVGHSQIVSPLGVVVAQAGEAPELLVADLDLADVDEARRAVPVLRNAKLS